MGIMLLVQMTTIVMAIAAAVMVTWITIVQSVTVTTDVGTIVGGNDKSSVVARDGSSGNGENAKSGIDTTVCGPGAAHACQTSSADEQ